MAKRQKSNGIGATLETISNKVIVWSGSSAAFLMAFSSIVIWAASGPLLHFSDTWQLTINTGTTILTFLMVFLIQRAQNKESLAVQLKLDEIIASLEGASTRLIDIEHLSEEEVAQLQKKYRDLGKVLKQQNRHRESHSIEEKLNTEGAGKKSSKRA